MRQLEIIPFQEDRLVLICSPEHELAGRSEVDIRTISKHKLVGFDTDIEEFDFER